MKTSLIVICKDVQDPSKVTDQSTPRGTACSFIFNLALDLICTQSFPVFAAYMQWFTMIIDIRDKIVF